MNFAQIYFRKKRRQLESISDFKVLFGLMFAVTFLICVIFLMAWVRSSVRDPKINMTVLTEKDFNAAKNTIETGLIISNFYSFDVLENNFLMNGTIWFLCNNSEQNLKNIDFFSFEDATIVKKSEQYKDFLPNNKILIRYDIEVQLNGNFNFNYYPFDYHRINFVLVNKSLDFNDTLYISYPQNFIIKPNTFTRDWVINNHFVENGKDDINIMINQQSKKLTYERVVFSLEFQRKSLKQLFLLFLPLFLIFYIGLLSLIFDLMTQFPIILSLCLGSTTALIFFLDLLKKNSPNTGTFSLVDMIYIFLLFIIIVTFIVQIIAANYLYQMQRKTKLEEVISNTVITLNIIRSLFFIFFIILMLVIVAWLLLL
ncbi:MAG: hypothetical protein K2X90_02950 [Candidatus Babeliaceae bacterium]|nr:hypothetical protein [Candidatus Babeliaceae bacterium]